ncbi:MAG: hypothetical protein KIT44_10290, partial [Opitutaceae bacterium]|nr:hypothetical protein [Opitutaceae bacterium]
QILFSKDPASRLSTLGKSNSTSMKKAGKGKIRTPLFGTEGYQTNLTSRNGIALPDLNKVKVWPLNGGTGRKASGRQPVLLRLTPKTVRSLRAAARKQGKTIFEVAEELLVAA